MTASTPEPRKDLICRCSGTTTERIKQLVDRGVDDLESISQATGACSGCGSCDTDILALLAEYATPPAVQEPADWCGAS